MFLRKGSVLGSVLHSAVPKAEPAPRVRKAEPAIGPIKYREKPKAEPAQPVKSFGGKVVKTVPATAASDESAAVKSTE